MLVEVNQEPQAGDDLTLADGRLVVRVVGYGRRPDGTLAYYVAVCRADKQRPKLGSRLAAPRIRRAETT